MTRARFVELLVWWAALTGLECLLVSVVDLPELLLAAGVGLIAASAAVAAGASSQVPQRPPARALRWAVRLPAAVLRDTVTVWLAVLRGQQGSWRDLAIPGAAGDGPGAAGTRGAAAIVLSTAPGSLCVDIDADSGTARLHALGGRPGSALERAVSR